MYQIPTALTTRTFLEMHIQSLRRENVAKLSNFFELKVKS